MVTRTDAGVVHASFRVWKTVGFHINSVVNRVSAR